MTKKKGNSDNSALFHIDQDDLSEYIQSKLKLDVDTVDAVLDAELAYLETRGLAGEEGAMADVVPMDSSVDRKELMRYIAEKTGIVGNVVKRVLDAEEEYLEKQA